jgi:hypothetical protein
MIGLEPSPELGPAAAVPHGAGGTVRRSAPGFAKDTSVLIVRGRCAGQSIAIMTFDAFTTA